MTEEAWRVVWMCFLVPFAITSGIAAPILIGQWIEKRFGLSKPKDKSDAH